MADVAVTGSLGTLGRAVVPALRAAGHQVRSVDYRDGAAGVDILDPPALAAAFDGVDKVVHLASIHGRDHAARFSPAEFWAANATGTFNVYAAAAHAGVSSVVLASTMGVYGPLPCAPRRSWVYRDEDSPVVPHDVYAHTKLVSEATASFAASKYGIDSFVLRFGHFAPCDVLHYGFRLLYGGVDVRDAASAVTRCLEIEGPRASVVTLNIHAPSPLVARFSELDGSPEQLLRDLSPALAARVDLGPHLWGRSVWPIDRARAVLGFEPSYTFARFERAVLDDDLGCYRDLDAPRWGVTT